MAEAIALVLSPREVTGKKVKRLRSAGLVPVHLYGGSGKPLSLQVEAGILLRVLVRVGGNIPLSVAVEGAKGENICFVREVQRHPVTEDILHVDFLRVEATQTLTAEVPIILDGEAPAVRGLGGTLAQPLSTVRVEALPLEMPAEFHVDISALETFEAAVRVGDIVVGENVTVLVQPEELIARVMPPRLEEEPVLAAEEGEALDELGAPVEEGEAAEGADAEAGSTEESS